MATGGNSSGTTDLGSGVLAKNVVVLDSSKNIIDAFGGSGGGAATVADGADVAQGAVADAAVAAGAAGTLSAKLRRLTTDIGALVTQGTAATVADGADVAEGLVGDAAVAAGAAGTLSAKLRRVTTDLDAASTKLSSLVTLLAGGLPAALATGGGLKSTPQGTDGLVVFPVAAAPANATAYGLLTKLMALGMLDNGATLDMAHGTKEITALASAARTATTQSADFTNVSARGITLWLNVTVASGTGGLQVRVQVKNPITAAYAYLGAAPTAVIATSNGLYITYPTAATVAGSVVQAINDVLPRTWRVEVTHGDASSYTYSVAAMLLL